MASMVVCQHCGDEHPAEVRRCVRTAEAMTSPGPCGSKVDRYLVKRLLGVGGFGAVYQAVHTRTDAQVALKVLRKDRAQDAAAVERFMREARAAALLGSEHIVRVLDAEVAENGVPFIAMELLEGTDLAELDKSRGPLPPQRLVNIMIQALSALQAAHDKGIVHRDMKPANVFITRRKDATGIEHDFVKLLDFGISKMQVVGEKVLTLAGTTMGTPAYMAYEQFFDARSVDARADVYSVAAILYELLSRQRPFAANSYGEWVIKVETETPAPLKSVAPTLPLELCEVIDKGLKKDREERWQSASALATALGNVSLRGVVLRTELAQAAALPADETKVRAPGTEPHGSPAVVGDRSVQRGELKTVLMDVGAPSPREGVGNSTVLMNPGDFQLGSGENPIPADESIDASSRPTAPRGVPANPSNDDEVNISTAKKGMPAMPPEVAKQYQSTLFLGPRDESTGELQRKAVQGGPFGLGWKLAAALGAGALLVIGMLVWVIVLASHRP